MIRLDTIKLLKEKTELIEKYNKLSNATLHYKEVSDNYVSLMDSLLESTSTLELIPILVNAMRYLYKADSIVIYNDNKEKVYRSTVKYNEKEMNLDTETLSLEDAITEDDLVKIIASPLGVQTARIIIQCNNIIYYYIIIQRATNFMSYEIQTLRNLAKVYSSVHVNKIMLEYLSKLVITSTDAINFDPKTNAYSIRALQNDYSYYNKSKHTFIFMDLDKFKVVNDTYGHDIGDVVLIKFANHLKECADRIGGKAYRYGGEEFIIVAPGTITDVYENINKTRVAFSKEVFKAKNIEFNVTVSSGMYESKPGEKAEDCIKKADELLYKAKETGRNRICY